MKDFANRTSTKKANKRKSVFRSKRKSSNIISSEIILSLLTISAGLILTSIFFFKSDVRSLQSENVSNNITIDFPTSLMENSVLIESNSMLTEENCDYFVQIGAYGNKKFAVEAQNILNVEIEKISINDIYSSQLPGKLLHSVISGPYENRSAANNSKEKITKKGFNPRLRTVCRKK